MIEGAGSGTATTTDTDGNYSLDIPAGAFRLRWSKPGFQTRESTQWNVEPGATTAILQFVLPAGEPVPIPDMPPPLVTTDPLVVEVTAGRGSSGPAYIGESVVIPGTGPYSNIAFSWNIRGTPRTSAILFILAQEYRGTPGAITSATPGFVAQSTGSLPDAYTFDPRVRVQGGVKYWFYSGDRVPGFGYDNIIDTYPPGDFYVSNVGAPYVRPTLGGALIGYSKANFRLEGRRAP